MPLSSPFLLFFPQLFAFLLISPIHQVTGTECWNTGRGLVTNTSSQKLQLGTAKRTPTSTNSSRLVTGRFWVEWPTRSSGWIEWCSHFLPLTPQSLHPPLSESNVDSESDVQSWREILCHSGHWPQGQNLRHGHGKTQEGYRRKSQAGEKGISLKRMRK